MRTEIDDKNKFFYFYEKLGTLVILKFVIAVCK